MDDLERLTDPLDQASALETAEREYQISEVRRRTGLPITGACYYCGEMCAGLFCCKDCQEDWQKAEDARKRNGK